MTYAKPSRQECSDCLCGGAGEVLFTDPVTGRPASMLCPACTPEGLALDPIVEDGNEDPHRCPDCGDEGWIHIGGPDSVRCETCSDSGADDANWQVGDITYGGIVTKDQLDAGGEGGT